MKKTILVLLAFVFNDVYANSGEVCIEGGEGRSRELKKSDVFDVYFESLRQARRSLAQGDSDSAICHYEYAKSMVLPESNNFRIYAELALAYKSAGNMQMFIKNKQLFTLSLAVYTDLYLCIMSSEGKYRLEDSRKLGVPDIFIRYETEVANEMCFPDVKDLAISGMDKLVEEAELYALYSRLR